MNFDLLVLVLAALTAVTGYRSGAVRQLSSWIGLAAAYVCARPLAAAWGEGAARWLGWAPVVATVALSATLWVVLYVGASQVARLALNLLEPGKERGPLDQALGAVAGAAKGAAIVLAATSVLVALEKPLAGLGVDMTRRTEGSRVMAFVREHPLVGERRPTAASAVEQVKGKGAEAVSKVKGGAEAALKTVAPAGR
ncbi:MAG: CvpA family protein [Elusimicrobiota bacterium]|nr:CvpA family protein [Elusimicrobiota bacterium]